MGQKELKELLAVVGKQLQAEIERAISGVARADEITAKLEDYLRRSDALITTLEDPGDGAAAQLAGATDSSTKIAGMASEATNFLTQIKASVDSVQANVTEMEDAYEAFEAIQVQINEPTTGLQAKLTAAINLVAKITGDKDAAAAALAQIQSNLASVQQHIAEMTQAYDEFTEIKEQIDDGETGVAATLANVTAVKAQAETLGKDIQAYRDQAHDTTEAIKGLAATAKSSTEAVQEAEKESGRLRTNIEKIYQLAADTGLANAFDARRQDATGLAWGWLMTSGIIATLIAGIAIWLAFETKPATFGDYVFYRLSYLSPLAVLFIISFGQYLKERGLTERYAFKAAAALSLDSYTQLLTRRFPKEENEEQILDFVLSAMQNIYKEPHQDKARTSYKFDAGNNAVWVKYAADEYAEISKKPKEIHRQSTPKSGPAPQA